MNEIVPNSKMLTPPTYSKGESFGVCNVVLIRLYLANAYALLILSVLCCVLSVGARTQHVGVLSITNHLEVFES